MKENNIRKTRTAAFTGHRQMTIVEQNIIRERVGESIRNLYHKGITDFLCGMAWGFDLIAAEEVIRLKEELPGLRLIAVVPFFGQEQRWSLFLKARYNLAMEHADEVITTASHYHAGCYHVRDAFLVDNASEIVAYYDGKGKGGTAFTIARAEKKGLSIINLYK